jgi:ergothioneine biosynthesis protein EgtB
MKPQPNIPAHPIELHDALTATRVSRIALQYATVRAQTLRLAQPLSAEDCALQSMPDASPVKWHLAHTTWFFETFVLERFAPGYRLFNPHFRVLFNSYYVAVGPRHPRPERGLLSRPSLDEVCAYRQHVDNHMTALLADVSLHAAVIDLIELGINHEQQHQELIVTDLKHLLSRNPLRPRYRASAITVQGTMSPISWRASPDGIRQIGHQGDGFHFDNEGPRHRVFINAFEIASQPVSNAEFAQFIADDGYSRAEFWLSEGWDVKNAQGWNAPLYWEAGDGGWQAFTLNGMQTVDPHAPVCHVSFFEADAYARWAQTRLPTEVEWECFAGTHAISGNFLEDGRFHPVPINVSSNAGSNDVYGNVWQWTRSAYEPYPGYRTAPGAVGEYNGKFMSNQYVLRGGSCATPASHIRATYRNFFPAAARWQFSGIRLARDLA